MVTLQYGIADEDGTAGLAAPIVGQSADEASRRLTQIVDAYLEARVNGIAGHGRAFKDCSARRAVIAG